MKIKIIFINLLISSLSFSASDNHYQSKEKVNSSISKEEVVENPTLKTLSGSLNVWSLYSSYSYKGGSLAEPGSAERPNILEAAETPALASMQGNFGLKYRASKSDNFSFQVGMYSTAPFHSSYVASSEQNQKDFDKNAQNLDVDDPVISYFKTYYIGELQNITFLKYQYATRGIYRDRGLHSVSSLSHAAAYRLNKFSYIAGSLTYEYYGYDQSNTEYKGFKVSLLPFQVEQRFRGNITGEMYLSKKFAIRGITDIFSYFKMRKVDEIEERGLQQTLALTYFYNRDISIAPNVKFIAEDIRSDRTNLGLTLNMNL